MRLISFLILIFSCGTVAAQPSDGDSVALIDSFALPQPSTQIGVPYSLTVAHRTVDWPLEEDTVDVLIETGEAAFGGFDLTLAIGSRDYEISLVLPGDFIERCDWEFFNARDDLIEASDGRMLRGWKVIGLSRVMPDSVGPICRGTEKPMSLMRLVVKSRPGTIAQPGPVPIFFVWTDCGDNTLSDTTGNSLYVSERVSNYIRPGPELSSNAFPNFTGAPRQCRTTPRIIGAIEFRSGGIVVEAPVDTTGAK